MRVILWNRWTYQLWDFRVRCCFLQCRGSVIVYILKYSSSLAYHFYFILHTILYRISFLYHFFPFFDFSYLLFSYFYFQYVPQRERCKFWSGSAVIGSEKTPTGHGCDASSGTRVTDINIKRVCPKLADRGVSDSLCGYVGSSADQCGVLRRYQLVHV